MQKTDLETKLEPVTPGKHQNHLTFIKNIHIIF